jgi:hypothetical protein
VGGEWKCFGGKYFHHLQGGNELYLDGAGCSINMLVQQPETQCRNLVDHNMKRKTFDEVTRRIVLDGPGFDSHKGHVFFLKVFQAGSFAHAACYFQWLRRSGRVADHTPSSGAEVERHLSLLYAFMA